MIGIAFEVGFLCTSTGAVVLADVPATPEPTARVLAGFLAAQTLALVAYWFVPIGSWTHSLWQMVVNSTSAVFMLIGVRRFRPAGALAWYLIGGGILLNSAGVVVEQMALRWFGVRTGPSVADAFWLALYPAAIAGLGMLVFRGTTREDFGTMMLNTTICVLLDLVVGILAWQYVVWQPMTNMTITLAYRVTVTVYPLVDLFVMSLVLRLLLSTGAKNLSMWLVVAWFLLLLPSDLGWASSMRIGHSPARLHQYLMEATWTASCALMGAAVWHRDLRTIGRAPEDRTPRLDAFGWLSLLACTLMAPLVVLLQVLLDRFYRLSDF
jgi:hypothetical protein